MEFYKLLNVLPNILGTLKNVLSRDMNGLVAELLSRRNLKSVGLFLGIYIPYVVY